MPPTDPPTDPATGADGAGSRPVALVTGASRKVGIGAAVARALAADGWDVATTFWRPYDERMPWGADDGPTVLATELAELGARSCTIEADLSRPEVPIEVLGSAGAALGPVRALVLNHCESVDGGILDTTLDSFDRHLAVNARAGWLLIRAFAEQFAGPTGLGRIVALTSDAVAGNLAYGASKGALDRVVLAAANDLAPLGITANCVNPGATDTGWMTPHLQLEVEAATLGGRIGRPDDAARLIAFLCSPAGGWVNAQLLHSNGGLRPG